MAPPPPSLRAVGYFFTPEKKVFWEKSHFMKYPVYFILIFNISGNIMKQELLKMVQEYCFKFFFNFYSEK